MSDASQPATGIHCPRCHCRDLRDESGRPAGLSRTRDAWAVTKVEAKRGYIRRRRICRNCGHVVFTREQIETHNPYKVRP